MSYPDVTLLRDICAVLGVTEHELLTASEDTERRSADRLAAKYLRLTRNYRAALYILFGAVLLGCAIGNLAAQGTLSWFWIVLAAVGLAASPTLVPALAIMNPKTEGVKWHLAAASFLVWLELLLLDCRHRGSQNFRIQLRYGLTLGEYSLETGSFIFAGADGPVLSSGDGKDQLLSGIFVDGLASHYRVQFSLQLWFIGLYGVYNTRKLDTLWLSY